MGSGGNEVSELLTVAEVALILKCSEDAVTRRFASMSGVVDLAQGRKGNRRYRVLRIPKPVLEKYLSTKAGRLVTVQVPPRPERRRKSDNWQTAAILNLAKAGKQNECRDKATLRNIADRASWLLNAKSVSEPDWPELAALLTDSDRFKDEDEDFE
jgi:hypothetical protein